MSWWRRIAIGTLIPPYVGHRGWLGVYLDVSVDWDAVDAIVGDAYHTTAGRPR